jgi:hypothetical protein
MARGHLLFSLPMMPRRYLEAHGEQNLGSMSRTGSALFRGPPQF